MDQDIRWQQRLNNFSRAVKLLEEASMLDPSSLSMLEKEGMIQRFEYTLELAWKTLKDKMLNDGIILDRISPKMVVKQAYQSKYIDDVEIWLKMINDRNLLSHTYDIQTFDAIIPSIQTTYTHELLRLLQALTQ